jgi:choline kinase
MRPNASNLPTLLILAAGVGSRFGGLKQLAPVGPGGQAILDFTIEDAWRAGFGRVVVVARAQTQARVEEHLREHHPAITRAEGREEGHASFSIDVVVQPGAPGSSRWGTGYAVLAAAPVVTGPFAVANADDYYGRGSLARMADHLADPQRAREWAMVAFDLARTLSDHGGVSRGICAPSREGFLLSLREATGITRNPDGVIHDDDGAALDPDTPVSMNLWGFGPEVFDLLSELAEEHAAGGQGVGTGPVDGAAEFRLPDAVGEAIRRGAGRVRMLRTSERWTGLTHPGDLEETRRILGERRGLGLGER